MDEQAGSRRNERRTLLSDGAGSDPDNWKLVSENCSEECGRVVYEEFPRIKSGESIEEKLKRKDIRQIGRRNLKS